jgi:hypothetical protein
MIVEYIPPPSTPKPEGTVTLTLTESEAQRLFSFCMYGARWNLGPIGTLADRLYHELKEEVPSFANNAKATQEGQDFREAMGWWFEQNKFIWS